MRKPSRRALLIGSVVALAAVGAAGGAVAASGRGTSDPQSEKQAFLNDAAGRLGVSSAKLEAALKAAAIDRIDAALAAGQITKDQADAMKAAINSGRLPVGIPFGPKPGMPGGHIFYGGDVLHAAATYLGLTDEQLQTQLASGKSLADIARAQGKSVDGLKQVMIAPVQAKLDQAVKDGKLTSAQRDQALAKITASMDDLINGTLPTKPLREGFRPFGFGFGLAPHLRIMPGAFHAPSFRYGTPGAALPTA